MNGTTQDTTTLENYYPRKVNVICDPQASVQAQAHGQARDAGYASTSPSPPHQVDTVPIIGNHIRGGKSSLSVGSSSTGDTGGLQIMSKGPSTSASSNLVDGLKDENTGVFLELQTCWTMVTVDSLTAREMLQMLSAGEDGISKSATTATGIIVYDKESRRVIADSVEALHALTLVESNSNNVNINAPNPKATKLSLTQVQMIDCPAATTSTFTTPCPAMTYFSNYNQT